MSLILTLLILCWLVIKNKIKLNWKQNWLLMFFIVTQALSVIPAINIESYFSVYKNLILSFIIYIIFRGYYFKKNKFNIVNLTLIIAFSINLILNCMIFFGPRSLNDYLMNYLLNPETKEYIKASLYHNRLFFQSYIFCLIPMLFYQANITKIQFVRWLMIFLVMVSFLIANYSHFRISFIVTGSAILFSLLLFYKNFNNKLIILIIIIVLFLSTFIGSAANRLFSPDLSDLKTIDSRFRFWKESIYIGSYHILGVGLGNYYEYLTVPKTQAVLIAENKHWQTIVYQNPHNIFFNIYAESGIIGLISFCALIISYLFKDIKELLVKKNQLYLVIMLAFWELLLFGITNPTYSVQFWILFFILRSLLDSLIVKKIRN